MDYSTILCWARANQDVIQLLSTVVVAIATGIIARLTGKYTRWTIRLVEETQLLRKAQTAPHISLYLEWSSLETFIAYLIVRNDGFRQARDLSFEADPDFHVRPNLKLSGYMFMQGLPALQPNEPRYLSLDTSEWFKMKMKTPDKAVPPHTKITVMYKDIEGKSYMEVFSLDLKAFDESKVSGMPPSHIDSITTSLKDISESLTSIDNKVSGKDQS
jgi:hypothetical protein